jgi:peroxiredoxin
VEGFVQTFLLISHLLSWGVALFLGFLLLGVCRTLGVVQWRLDKIELTTPRRAGREGLKPGVRAPDFTLPEVSGQVVSLHDFAGRRVLLAFMHSECGPCGEIAPELNRLHSDDLQVVAVASGDPGAVRRWAEETHARFPVLVQDGWTVSRRYQVYATPFAFLIDERGTIRSQGVITSRRYLSYVLTSAESNDRETAKVIQLEARRPGIAAGEH